MSSERLEDLIVISSESDIINAISLDKLVEDFKLSGNRRLPL